MQNIKNSIVSYPKCPVCNNHKRYQDGKNTSFSDGGRLYLKFVADKIGISVQELADNFKIFQCDECKSFWCDPWFNDNISSQIFTQGSPDHPASWSSFEQWLCKPEHTASLVNDRLYKFLESQIGAIDSYAEFGCPFNGFFLFFRGLEIDQKTRINIFSNAIKRPKDPRWSRMMRIHSVLNRIISQITIGYFKLSFFKEKAISLIPEVDKKNIPQERVLLTKESVKSWGNNCVRYGGSCKYFSSKILNTQVIPFDKHLDSIRKSNSSKRDLLGIFNILDHTDEPLNVIRNSLLMAKNVLIVSHTKSTAGKQHLYAFDDSFPKYLSNLFKNNYEVRDLTDSFYKENPNQYFKNHKYILISENQF
jgi:hypothetical protein